MKRRTSSPSGAGRCSGGPRSCDHQVGLRLGVAARSNRVLNPDLGLAALRNNTVRQIAGRKSVPGRSGTPRRPTAPHRGRHRCRLRGVRSLGGGERAVVRAWAGIRVQGDLGPVSHHIIAPSRHSSLPGNKGLCSSRDYGRRRSPSGGRPLCRLRRSHCTATAALRGVPLFSRDAPHSCCGVDAGALGAVIGQRRIDVLHGQADLQMGDGEGRGHDLEAEHPLRRRLADPRTRERPEAAPAEVGGDATRFVLRGFDA